MDKASTAGAMALGARQSARIIGLSEIRFDGRRAVRWPSSTDRPWPALAGAP